MKITPPAVIDGGCIIGPGAEIKGPVIIGRECRIHENVTVENSVIWDRVTIGANAKIKGCIISSGTLIADSQVSENCIITHAQTIPLVSPGAIKK